MDEKLKQLKETKKYALAYYYKNKSKCNEARKANYHKKKGTYECPHCNKMFATNQTRKVHISKKHPN